MRVRAAPENIPERIGFAAGLAPLPLLEGFIAFAAARAIMAGSRLGVYEALAEQPDTAEGISRRLGLDPRGTDILLTALHAQGYVERRHGRYRNAATIERHMLDSGDRNVRDFAGGFAYDMWEHFSRLEEAVRTGHPIGLHDRPPDDPYWERYMRGLHALSRLGADRIAKMIPARDPGRMLDLAGGHGGYAMAMCRRHPGLHARVAELEGAARWGRRIVEEEGMSDRVQFAVGDMFEVDLGDGYDVATAFQIVHHFDAERNVELLRLAHRALRDGGTVAVAEQERPAEDERGSQIGAVTGLLFFVTSAARTYSAAEVEGFLRAAGFRQVRTRRHVELPGMMLVTGEK